VCSSAHWAAFVKRKATADRRPPVPMGPSRHPTREGGSCCTVLAATPPGRLNAAAAIAAHTDRNGRAQGVPSAGIAGGTPKRVHWAPHPRPRIGRHFLPRPATLVGSPVPRFARAGTKCAFRAASGSHGRAGAHWWTLIVERATVGHPVSAGGKICTARPGRFPRSGEIMGSSTWHARCVLRAETFALRRRQRGGRNVNESSWADSRVRWCPRAAPRVERLGGAERDWHRRVRKQ
jgi:hypothetical protein